jgi:TRAP-type C4-dicarboxylate transport system permease small subunit
METLIRRLEQMGMFIACLCVVAIMLVVCFDAAGRYLFGAPLPWSFDLVSNYLMVTASYLALASTFRHGDHINIDVLHAKLPGRLRAWVEAICSVLAAVVFAGIVYGTARQTIEAFVQKEFYPGYIMWPAWLSYLPIPLGCALLVLRLVHHAMTLIGRGEDAYVASHGEGGIE